MASGWLASTSRPSFLSSCPMNNHASIKLCMNQNQFYLSKTATCLLVSNIPEICGSCYIVLETTILCNILESEIHRSLGKLYTVRVSLLIDRYSDDTLIVGENAAGCSTCLQICSLESVSTSFRVRLKSGSQTILSDAMPQT